MFGADRCLRVPRGACRARASRISSSFGNSLSSRKDPLRLALRMLLPEVLTVRLDEGRIMMSTSSASPSSKRRLSLSGCG